MVTVSVSTMAHSGVSFPSHTRRYFGPGAYKLSVPRLLFYMLLLLTLAWASRKLRRAPLVLMSALLLVMLIAGCAGGSGWEFRPARWRWIDGHASGNISTAGHWRPRLAFRVKQR